MGRINLCLLINILFIIKVNCDVIVETNLGKVAGLEAKSILKDEKYYSFMGIPYGQELTGKLKYTAPLPHEGWTEVLDVKKEKLGCPQNNLPFRPSKLQGFYGRDDCLHLSIHTPKLPNNDNPNLPVIVFLYNENFRFTHNGTREYGPDFFMKEDVIFVTISHRVGVLGFLSYEDEILPGNNGLRDIFLALKWLQANIHAFGGNPTRFTLMGASGGAALAESLILSPKAKGLFSGVILQSGTIYNSAYVPRNPRDKANALAKTLERSAVSGANLIEELSKLPVNKVIEAEPLSVDADESREHQSAATPFSPSIEHDHPDAIINKDFEDMSLDIDIPIMIGYNSREAIEMLERYLRKPQYLTFSDRDFLVVLPVRAGFRFELNTNTYMQAISEIKKKYFEDGYVKVSKPGEFITYIGDVFSVYPTDYAVRKYTNESNAPVYYYTFDYSGELNMRKNKILEEAVTTEGTWGATMGDELCYLFVCKKIRKKYIKLLKDEDSEELKVMRNMVKMWSDFTKTGNPTPDGSDFTWTPATKENKECLVISDELQMKTKLHDDRITFWDDFLAKYKAMAIDGVVRGEKDEL